MGRRVVTWAGLVLAIVLIVGGGLTWRYFSDREVVTTRPNVVLISIDTCRADHLSSYDSAAKTTPKIDAVARDGVLFTRTYSTNPITLPSHCSLLTGTYPTVHGVHNNHNYRLDDSNVTLAERLQAEGYRTAAFVSSFVLDSKFGLAQGFDSYSDQTFAKTDAINERRGEATTEDAVRWLEYSAKEPFFLFLHYFDPHMPYAPPEPFASRFTDSPYAGEVAYVDYCIGQVVQKLKSEGLYDSTLLIITADHGESLGEHGEDTHSFFIYQGVVQIPLIIKAPGGGKSIRVEEPTSIVDVTPTVLGLLDLDAAPEIQGEDLSAWVMGGGVAKERDLYCESYVPMEYGCSSLRGVIRDRWKYIWSTKPELYDLDRDPMESTNLVDAEPAIAAELLAGLKRILVERPRSDIAESTPELDRETLERLRSLGYVAGGTNVQPSPGLEPRGEDPKEFIQDLNRLLRATEFRAQGRFEQARMECLEVLEKQPGNLRAIQIMGDACLAEGRFEDAVGYYTRYLTTAADAGGATATGTVLRMDADLAEVHYNLASILHRAQQLDAAFSHYQQAIQLQADFADAYNGLGAVLAQQGRTHEAIQQFERALAINPKLESARQNLAMARSDLGQGN